MKNSETQTLSQKNIIDNAIRIGVIALLTALL